MAANGFINRVVFTMALGIAMFAYMMIVSPKERFASPPIDDLRIQKAITEKTQSNRIAYLISAAYNGDIDEIKRLIAINTDVNSANERFVSPLIAAASGCQLSVVEFLLAKGADASAQTIEGFNAYDFAFYNNDVTIAALVRRGSRPPKPMAKPIDLNVQILKAVDAGLSD